MLKSSIVIFPSLFKSESAKPDLLNLERIILRSSIFTLPSLLISPRLPEVVEVEVEVEVDVDVDVDVDEELPPLLVPPEVPPVAI